jgi:hypothetical protein
VRSQEVLFTVASAPFALTSAQPVVNITAGGQATVPVTLDAEAALFFPNVWLSTDLGAAAAGITAGFVDDNEGINELNANRPTRQLEIRVDGSVPSGSYPIVISGYNGEAKEVLSLEVVVDNPTATPATSVYLPLITKWLSCGCGIAQTPHPQRAAFSEPHPASASWLKGMGVHVTILHVYCTCRIPLGCKHELSPTWQKAVETTCWYEKPRPGGTRTGLNRFFIPDRHFNAGR